MPPEFVEYGTSDEYRRHYKRVYCQGKIVTADGIRVYFSPDRFNHAFYSSSSRDGRKDSFARDRARCIDWIKVTLESETAILHVGWDKYHKCLQWNRRVAVLHEDFVVVIELRRTKDGVAKGNFITAFRADESLEKIMRAPLWNLETWLAGE